MERTIDEIRAAYAWQMAAGMCPPSLKCSTQEQLDHFCQARIYDRSLVMLTRPVLLERGIPGGEHIYYYAFARALARLCRIYSSRTLLRATEDLIDRWEFRGLDLATLLALRNKVYGFAGQPEREQ
ncbi:MAG: hypothetical protein ABIL25_07635 [candidate division WOR-3 bacterium]